MARSRELRRLAIVSHCTQYRAADGRRAAYGPFVREIDLWCDLFAEVVMHAPVADPDEAVPGDARVYGRTNIAIEPLPRTGGRSIAAKLLQLLRLPELAWRIRRRARRADALHVRCPGNVGLIGVLVGPLTGRPRIAKYAGQWSAYPGESRTVALQRWLLRRWWGAPVTVYGAWPRQPAHVVPFYSSATTAAQMARAREIAAGRRVEAPVAPTAVAFVGRLSANKGVDVLLRGLATARAAGAPMTATIVGDGAERPALESLAAELGLVDAVTFTGALPFEAVIDVYARSQILALLSGTEGWPKVIAEAMAFGVVPIGSDRGAIPSLLGAGDVSLSVGGTEPSDAGPRGIVVPHGDADAVCDALLALHRDPAGWAGMSARGVAWAGRFTLEQMRADLDELLNERWPGTTRPRPPMPPTTDGSAA
jgi:glycosyltransferase involved in cell wall biosynthesis